MHILYFVYLPLSHHKEVEMNNNPSSASLELMILRVDSLTVNHSLVCQGEVKAE